MSKMNIFWGFSSKVLYWGGSVGGFVVLREMPQNVSAGVFEVIEVTNQVPRIDLLVTLRNCETDEMITGMFIESHNSHPVPASKYTNVYKMEKATDAVKRNEELSRDEVIANMITETRELKRQLSIAKMALDRAKE